MLDWITCTIIVILATLFYIKFNAKRSKTYKPIPQPIGWPILGNLLQLRKQHPYIQMAEWTKQLGPIYRLKIASSSLIVIGSPKVAVELLDQRSSKYSSRPRNIMTSEYVSQSLRLTFMPYNDLWRRERKLLHLIAQPKQASNYKHIQSMESIQLCQDLLLSPQDHWKHSQRFAGSTVLQIAFNRRAASLEDPAIIKMREYNDKMIQTAVPGNYLIDSIPILDHLPEFLSPWKRYGRLLFNQTLELYQSLYQNVPPLTSYLNPTPCFVNRIEELKNQYQLTDPQAIFLAGTMFGAGSDTTADAIETFIFACAANPDKVAKAHEELDRVVGRDRLPDFNDQDSLVYCGAMVRELLRWRTVIPGGLAHMTTEDDEYLGYFIPKGSSIVANHWAIHLDEETYEQPEKFMPERFIDPETGTSLIGTKWSSLGHHAFGFGRRVCPGLHIANNSLFITFTRILWCFNITLPLTKTRKETKYFDLNDDEAEEKNQLNEFIKSVKFSTGFSSHPINLNSFAILISPRHDLVPQVLNLSSRVD